VSEAAVHRREADSNSGRRQLEARAGEPDELIFARSV
jgi:hypothetical protein